MDTTQIVFIDIETSPNLSWIWGKWEQNALGNKSDWYILSYAYKFVGDSKVTVRGLIDLPSHKRNRENDKQLVKELWHILDRADIVIAHNGNRFDLAKIKTRFIIHGLKPPSPYRTIDTLMIARREFAFDSNKLDDLGAYLKIGRKLPHTGFHLWKGCMEDDPESWKTMLKYNAHDVELLESVYYKMRPWYTAHPSVVQGEQGVCPKCGSDKLQRRGFNYTLLSKSQRYACLGCHGWFQGSSKRIK